MPKAVAPAGLSLDPAPPAVGPPQHIPAGHQGPRAPREGVVAAATAPPPSPWVGGYVCPPHPRQPEDTTGQTLGGCCWGQAAVEGCWPTQSRAGVGDGCPEQHRALPTPPSAVVTDPCFGQRTPRCGVKGVCGGQVAPRQPAPGWCSLTSLLRCAQHLRAHAGAPGASSSTHCTNCSPSPAKGWLRGSQATLPPSPVPPVPRDPTDLLRLCLRCRSSCH